MVINRPALALDHAYRLTNPTDGDLKLLVTNRKPCCGVVTLAKDVLKPGESTEVGVRLVVGDKFGAVDHFAEVATEPPSPEEIVLKTSAEAHPALVFEDLGSSGQETVLLNGPPHRVEFRVVARGVPAAPPVDLDRLVPRSSAEVGWLGPKVPDPSEDGLRVETRRGFVALDAAGPPGEKAATVALMDEGATILERAIHWEVVTPLAATPGMIVLRPGTTSHRLLIRALDGKPFRVTEIASDVPGLTAAVPSGSAASHTLTIADEGPSEPRP